MIASSEQIAVLENLLVRVKRNRDAMISERANPPISAEVAEPSHPIVAAPAPQIAPKAVAPASPEPIPLTAPAASRPVGFSAVPVKTEVQSPPRHADDAIELDTQDAIPLETEDAIPLETTAVATTMEVASPEVRSLQGSAMTTAPVATVSGKPVAAREWTIAAVLDRAFRLGQ